ncbi:hypothetical protein SAMN05660649_03243 [Desulfotomaculum arcticum]|uniref:Uncharacterized protein n=1 Tax=Desulfotruncus arcticus DSM 17038 TaxID=1121424 RepID=A0A1I2VYH2_9FIRM|nr:hypothetical protein SAMN05660649_03243 [Desulfotomaculum arcticum] [Desulfotruncus arcticus DSM 17038]
MKRLLAVVKKKGNRRQPLMEPQKIIIGILSVLELEKLVLLVFIVRPALCYLNVIVLYPIDKPILFINASAPKS